MDRYQRIFSSGQIVAVNVSRYSSENIDPNNMTGKVINVWVNGFTKHAYMDLIVENWKIIQETLQFKSVHRPIVARDKLFEQVGFREGVILWPFATIHSGWKSIDPYIYGWYELYMAKPSPEKTSAFFISTLSLPCWIAAIVSILTLLGVIWAMFIWCPQSSSNLKLSYLEDCLLIISRILTSQGVIKSPQRTSFRIFLLTASIFGFLFLIWYSALLTSKLTVSVASQPIKTLEDIPRRRTHSLCVQKQRKTAIFEDAKWRGLLDDPNCKGKMKLVLPRVCKKKIIGLYISRSIPYSDGSKFGKCIVIALKEKLFSSKLILPGTKRFVYAKLINKLLLKMRNVGIHNYWYRRIMYTSSSPYIKEEPYQEIALSNIISVLAAYSVMILFSIILLVLEWCYRYLIHRSTQHSYP